MIHVNLLAESTCPYTTFEAPFLHQCFMTDNLLGQTHPMQALIPDGVLNKYSGTGLEKPPHWP